MTTPRIPSALLFVCLAVPASAQERTPAFALPEITVFGASLVPVDASRVGSAVTVITDQQIREQGAQTLPDVLRLVPGVAISQSGGRGALTQIRLRGAEARHTLVVVDGVPINDVNNGDADLANLPVDNVERVEVVRGAQSGVWGPNAQAGVVIITTRSGKGLARPEVTARVEGGSFGTLQASASARGAQGPFYGAVSVSGLTSGGHVVAPGTTRPNGSDMAQASVRLGVDPTEWFNLEGSLRVLSRSNVYNPGIFAFGPGFAPDPNYGFLANGIGRNTIQDWQGRLAATFTLLEGRWTHRFSADSSRQGTHGRDSYVSGFGITESQNLWSRTERNRAEYRTAYTWETPALLGARHTFVGGADIAQERFRYYYESDGFFGPFVNDTYVNGRTRERRGLYGEYLLALSTGFSLSAVLRQDWNSNFRNAATWRVTAAQTFESGTRLHASAGKGVTNPTFFQQFGFFANFVGNPTLRPEQSIGFDAGIEQRWFGGRLVADVTYFHSNLRDAIVASGITAINLPFETRRQGIEASITARPLDWLSFNGSYTYTDTRSADLVGPAYVFKAALRRPKHAASLSTTADFADGRGKATVTIAHNGTMRDLFFGPFGNQDVWLRSFTLIGAQLSYDVTRNATVYVRGENIFGQRYQEVFGFNAQGAAVYAGLRVRLGE